MHTHIENHHLGKGRIAFTCQIALYYFHILFNIIEGNVYTKQYYLCVSLSYVSKSLLYKEEKRRI